MTRLFLVRENGLSLWIAALIDEDIWTYVANTGRFHRNDGLRHDYFMLNELEYTEIGPAEARRLMRENVGLLDEQLSADVLTDWRDDRDALPPDTVLAASVAELN